MRTKRLVFDVNAINSSSVLMLTKLTLTSYQQNSDGTREFNEMVNQNTEIEQQIKKSLRILQQIQSNQNDKLCEGIPQDECGNVNEVPLVTVVTDQQTGQVQTIGVPSGVSDIILQPLVSNIIHIAPNLAESSNSTNSNGWRLLDEQYSNIYYIGKLAFLPKFSKTQHWFGNTVVKKTISQSDSIDGDSQGVNLFDKFEQSQETNLDNYNYLVSSKITTNSILDNSINSEDQNQNGQDLTEKSQTEITNDSNLVTIETKSDQDLTNVLTEVQSKQQIQYYTIQSLQDRLQNQQDQNQSTQENQQQNNRLLEDENGDVQSSAEAQYENQTGECNSTIFNQKRTLKEATVLKNKIGLQVEFKGDLKEGNVQGYLKSCVSLNGNCKVDLYKKDFQYKGKPLQTTFNNKGSQAQNLFKAYILLMGYPITIGANYAYSWGYIESDVKTDSELGIQEQIYASLRVTAYGELSLIRIINIRAGVDGYIFKGYANGVAQFKINQVDKTVLTNKYLIYIDYQVEALSIDVYANYQHISINWVRKCIGKRWWKICVRIPQLGYSNWKDIYRKSFNLAKISSKKRVYEIKSKCY